MRTIIANVGGLEYKIRQDEKVLARFLDWADKVLPNPIERLRDMVKDFPQHIQELMTREALAKLDNRRNFNSAEVQALAMTPEGGMKMLALCFQRLNPTLTDTDVENLVAKAEEEHGENYLKELLDPH